MKFEEWMNSEYLEPGWDGGWDRKDMSDAFDAGRKAGMLEAAAIVKERGLSVGGAINPEITAKAIMDSAAQSKEVVK